MALVHRFASEFTDPDYGNPSFWQESVNDGSISQSETARASVQVRGPSGRTYWVFPGEVSNLRAQGFSIGPPVPRTQAQMAAEAQRLNLGAVDPLDLNFGMPDPADLQLLSTAPSGDITGPTGPIGAPQQGILNRIIQQIDDDLIKDEDAAWDALRKAVGNQEEAVRLWNGFFNSPEWQRATTKWAEGFVSDKDRDAEKRWAARLADKSVTWEEAKNWLERNGDPNDRAGLIARLEAQYGPGAIDTGAVRADRQKTILDKWNRGGYTSIEQLIEDIRIAGNFESRDDALPTYDAWQAAGLITGSSGIKEGEPGEPVQPRVVAASGDIPQRGRFSQFAKFREVDPELGGPAGRELERQFEPLERAYSAYSALSPYIDPIDPDIDVTAPGYAPQTFSDYLQRRGGSLQSARMGSFDILRRLGKMTPVSREQQGLLFGNVYDEQGSPLTTGVKGFRQTQMDQAIEDAAAAQYGRRGGEFVGGQLPRQRRLFEAQQQSPSGAEATNFFDYIRNKYGLQF